MRVREASDGDYEAYSRLFPELGLGDPLPDFDRFQREIAPHAWICESDGAAVGYALHFIMGGTIFVRNVVTAPSMRGRGVGRLLMERVRAFGLGRGLASWALNVKPDNVAAVALYEKVGLRVSHRSYALRMAWSDAQRLAPGSADVGVAPPEGDSAIERRLSMVSGQLAAGRAQPGRVVLSAHRGAEPVGALVFHPNFPGASPFSAESLDVAASLLHRTHTYAREGDADINLMMERQEEVAFGLRDAGAILRFELLQMVGPLKSGA